MRAILCLLIFSTILCNAAFVNLCKIHECEISTQLFSSPTIDFPPAIKTYPNIQNNTFVYVSSTTLIKPAQNDTGSAILDVIIEMKNMTFAFCHQGYCWMRIRFADACKFETGAVSGYYIFKDDHTLSLYPSVIVNYSSNYCPIVFETCIQDPMTPMLNHCAEDMKSSKFLLQIQRFFPL